MSPLYRGEGKGRKASTCGTVHTFIPGDILATGGGQEAATSPYTSPEDITETSKYKTFVK